MNFRIHTIKEELNKGILLDLNGSMPFKNSRHINIASEVLQSCLCDPMDCSLPHSSVHGIFQARVLEWVAISYLPPLALLPGKA